MLHWLKNQWLTVITVEWNLSKLSKLTGTETILNYITACETMHKTKCVIEDKLDTECVNVKLCTKYVIGDEHFTKYVIKDELDAECVNARPETLDTLLGLSPLALPHILKPDSRMYVHSTVS